jgi:hypothetical protein
MAGMLTGSRVPGRVGKTSILLRYIRGEYDDKQVSTLQASYLDKKITVDNKVRQCDLATLIKPLNDALFHRQYNSRCGIPLDKSVFMHLDRSITATQVFFLEIAMNSPLSLFLKQVVALLQMVHFWCMTSLMSSRF